ncbi:MAG: AMP-binding protein, partial [Verrucomicrobia bacterium]|nr:AMP-binding protein [Verrucomicrobiota bacterium]
ANSVEAVVGIFAVLKAGALFVMVNRNIKTDKLTFILNNCRASALITDARAIDNGVGGTLLEKVSSLSHLVFVGGKLRDPFAVHPRCHSFFFRAEDTPLTPPTNGAIDLDLACLIYTSGTTGEAKGVMCDHSNVVFVTRSIVQSLRNTADDTVLSVLPLAFSYGLYQLLATVFTGGRLVLEESFAFPAVIMQKLAQEQVTGFAGVPTIYSMLLGLDWRGQDLSRLRYLTNAAAGLPVEQVKRLRRLFPGVELYLMHGLTEVARTMRLPPEQVDLRPGASGIAIPGTELWLEDETGQRLGPGEVGELVVRGRHVMRGYWDDPQQTAQRFRPGPLPGERVCQTGDLFRTDEDGYFYYVSRKDDIIKCRGEKVAPREVENVLYAMPGVQDAAVVGIPDLLLGQAVKAFIVPSDARLTEPAVIAHCKARLEDFMVPQQIEFRCELPKTANGKVRRMDLR